MTRPGFWIVVGVCLAALGAVLFAREQRRLLGAVCVPGEVVRLTCRGQGEQRSCSRVVRFRTLDGLVVESEGPATEGGATFAAGEWVEVVYSPHDPTAVSLAGESGVLRGALLLLLAIGVLTAVAGWAARGPLPAPRRAPPPARARLVAGAVGLLGVALAHALVGAPALFAPIALGVVALGVAAAVWIILAQRTRPAGEPSPFGPLPAPPAVRSSVGLLPYSLALLALVLGLGLPVLPAALRPGLAAAAPLAVALTLPLQLRLWAALEAAAALRRAGALRRERLARAMSEVGAEVLVRVESLDEDAAVVVRRTAAGDRPLSVALTVFGPTLPATNGWWLVGGAVLERRPGPEGGYRETASVDFLRGAASAEPLGPDLGAVDGEPPAAPRPGILVVPVLVGLGVAGVGGWALLDRTPPLTGSLPAEALREGIAGAARFGGTVRAAAAWPGVAPGAACSVRITPSLGRPTNCAAEIACGGSVVFDAWARCLSGAAGTLVAEDASDSDGDPAILLDTRTRRLEVRRQSSSLAIELLP